MPGGLAAGVMGSVLWIMLGGWKAVAAVLVFILVPVFVGVASGRHRR
jgi:uncharacterized membrane protein